MKWSIERTEWLLAVLALGLGLLTVIGLLGRGLWLDEFWTLASTRPEQSWGQFWMIMANEVHPPLHYLLIQIFEKLGVTDVGALRALNILGVPLVLGAAWYAYRQKALDRGQICVLLALYASSPMFLSTFPDLRAYFLVFSSGIAVAVLARVLLQMELREQRWEWQPLLFWGLSLAIFVNLHYFSTFMGGLMTLALILVKRGRGVVPFLCVSAAAAVPAVLLFIIQSLSSGPDIIDWIQTGRIDAIFVMIDEIWSAGARNLVAFGLSVYVLLLLLERRLSWKDVRDPLVLIAVLIGFFGFLVLANAVRPLIIDRYLIAAGGCIITALALLAGGPQAPRWSVIAVCVFALLSQGRAIYKDTYDKTGWRAGAQTVAGLLEDCQSSRIFTEPTRKSEADYMMTHAVRYGLEYYASRNGFSFEELQKGDTVPAPGKCPNIIWFEHVLDADAGREDFLAEIELEFTGRVEMLRAERSMILINRGAES